ncbi:MAG: hypothetical protein H6835_00290 [Planctomycetes bacterium]|nr:hypothetical protein [Planctomycetota bacterium]
MTMLARLLPFLCAATPLLAQFDYDLEKRSPAQLGATIDLEVVGAPANSILLYLVSTNSGPTPLSWVDPGDLRVAAVGVDLLPSLSFGITSPTGGATYAVPLPNDPAANGAVFHWQSIQLLLGATFFGEMSNDVVTQCGLPLQSVQAPSSLAAARALSAIAVDADNDNSGGDVLIVGGGTGTLTAATGLASSELWSYRRMQRQAGPSMSVARALHLTVQLNDGRTLVIGGADQNGNVLSSCEIYDPATNSFSTTGSMGTPRILHAACRLADGRVMTCGGTSTLAPDLTAAVLGTLNTAEIYNPATGTWSGTANIGGYRLAPALTLLSTGQAMVSGGVQITFLFGFPIGAGTTTAAQRWNPATGTWGSAASMSVARAGHHFNQVTLNDNRVLMTGGTFLSLTSLSPLVVSTGTIAGAEAYNPTNNTWTTYNMASNRALHSATKLPDGRVVVCGGAQGTLDVPVPIDGVEVFNPVSNSWSGAPALLQARASHVASMMPDGTLVLFGGQGSASTLTSIETIRF